MLQVTRPSAGASVIMIKKDSSSENDMNVVNQADQPSAATADAGQSAESQDHPHVPPAAVDQPDHRSHLVLGPGGRVREALLPEAVQRPGG